MHATRHMRASFNLKSSLQRDGDKGKEEGARGEGG